MSVIPCVLSPVREDDLIDLRRVWIDPSRPSEHDTLKIIRRTAQAAVKMNHQHPREVLSAIAALADAALGRERP